MVIIVALSIWKKEHMRVASKKIYVDLTLILINGSEQAGKTTVRISE
jgi:hypothetical protein